MRKFIFSPAMLFLFLIGCSEDNIVSPTQSQFDNLELYITGLPQSSPVTNYEAWIVVDGVQQKVGIFTVSSLGQLSNNIFNVNSAALYNADAFILNINEDNMPNHRPVITQLLYGEFSGGIAVLKVSENIRSNKLNVNGIAVR